MSEQKINRANRAIESGEAIFRHVDVNIDIKCLTNHIEFFLLLTSQYFGFGYHKILRNTSALPRH